MYVFILYVMQRKKWQPLQCVLILLFPLMAATASTIQMRAFTQSHHASLPRLRHRPPHWDRQTTWVPATLTCPPWPWGWRTRTTSPSTLSKSTGLTSPSNSSSSTRSASKCLHFSLLNHYGLILYIREWNCCMWAISTLPKKQQRESADGQFFDELP